MCLPTHLRKAHAKPHSQRPQSNMSYKAGQVMKIMISPRWEGLPYFSAACPPSSGKHMQSLIAEDIPNSI